MDPVSNGIGFETALADAAGPESSGTPDRPRRPSRTIDGRKSRVEMVRVVEGVSKGETVITRNALGLFYEMEQHADDKQNEKPATQSTASQKPESKS